MKKTKGLFVFIFVLVAVVVIAAASILVLGPAPNGEAGKPRVDVVTVSGTITNSSDYQWLLSFLDSAKDDPNSLGLVLSVDSPGGGMYESDELYLKLMAYKAEGKPIYVSMQSMAASGGYYIAAAGDYLMANRSSTVGSIGVIMGTYFDFSELLANYGIKTVEIVSGPNKAMGSAYSEMTEEQALILQGIVDEMYGRFVEVVAAGRGMSATRVRELADGRIYTANQALSLGLIDEIGSLEDAIARLKADYHLEENCPVLYQLAPVPTLWEQFTNLISGVQALPGNSEAAQLLELAEQLGSRIGYYCPYSDLLSAK